MESIHLILLVEDDPNDAFFLTRALSDAGYKGRVRHVTSSSEAKNYLAGSGPFSDRAAHPAPNLVISDSSLAAASASGVELLEWMRSGKMAEPFIMLSGSVQDDVRARAKAAGALRVMIKASDFRETAHELREVLAQLPG